EGSDLLGMAEPPCSPCVADPVESGVQTVMPDAGVPNARRGRSRDVPARRVLRVGDHRPRKSRTPPPTRGASTLCPPTPARSLGPDPLGLAVPPLDGLALQSRHRSARDRPCLAPPRFSALLAPAVHCGP